jgi:uncharacterized protein (DUF1800 family)
MRSPDQATARIVGPPPLPPLEVIALSRLTFGVRPGDREAFRALGANPPAQLQAYIDQQLDPASIDDSACDARLQAAAFTTLNKSLAQLWADHVVNNTQGWAYRILPAEETEKATFLRAVYSQRQLFELLVDFWHNHFNVYGWHYYVSPILAQYDREVIRAHALGNFRQMLEAVATSTAMLFYLDNYISQAGGFNENFARELLELHTLGAENYLGVKDPFSVPVGADGVAVGYVDNDVYEAARCFTGWRVDYSSWEPGVGESGLFLYYAPWHDRANKFFLHKYLPADQPDLKDGRDVLDLLAYHPGTARHIARKLCRRLVSDYPPESLVQSAADEFLAHKQSPDQLKQVVRVIVLSAEFQAAWGQKVRRPFEAAVAMLRAANAEFTPSDSFLWNFNNLGQPLFSRIPPDGYPDLKAAWIGTTSFLQRWRLCNQLVEGWIDGVTLDFSQQMPAERRTPIAITDYWIERLLGRPVHPLANRAELVSFVAQGRNPDYDLPADLIAERVPRLAALILMTPDFQLR